MLLKRIYGWIPEGSAPRDTILSYFNLLLCPFMPLVPFPERLNHLYELMSNKDSDWEGSRMAAFEARAMSAGRYLLPGISWIRQGRLCLTCFLYSCKPSHKQVQTPPPEHKSSIFKFSRVPNSSCRSRSEFGLKDEQTAAGQAAVRNPPWY